jgi:hypothetical protein
VRVGKAKEPKRNDPKEKPLSRRRGKIIAIIKGQKYKDRARDHRQSSEHATQLRPPDATRDCDQGDDYRNHNGLDDDEHDGTSFCGRLRAVNA